MKTLLAITVVIFSTNVLAFDKESSLTSLQAALSESNKDYNTFKKAELEEDNNRIEKWNDRKVVAVKITAGIQVESRTYGIDANELAERQAEKDDLAEFHKVKKELPVFQEVSMND